jgi:hypothetical protein
MALAVFTEKFAPTKSLFAPKKRLFAPKKSLFAPKKSLFAPNQNCAKIKSFCAKKKSFCAKKKLYPIKMRRRKCERRMKIVRGNSKICFCRPIFFSRCLTASKHYLTPTLDKEKWQKNGLYRNADNFPVD